MKIHYLLHVLCASLILSLILTRPTQAPSMVESAGIQRLPREPLVASPQSLRASQVHKAPASPASAEVNSDEENAEELERKIAYKNYYDLRGRAFSVPIPEEVQSRWDRICAAMEQIALAAGMDEASADTSQWVDAETEAKLQKLLLKVDAKRKPHIEKLLLLAKERAAIYQQYQSPERLITDKQIFMLIGGLSETEYASVAERAALVVRGSEALRREGASAADRLEWEVQCRLLESEFAVLPCGKPDLEQWLQGKSEVTRREQASEWIEQMKDAIDHPKKEIQEPDEDEEP